MHVTQDSSLINELCTFDELYGDKAYRTKVVLRILMYILTNGNAATQ